MRKENKLFRWFTCLPRWKPEWVGETFQIGFHFWIRLRWCCDVYWTSLLDGLLSERFVDLIGCLTQHTIDPFTWIFLFKIPNEKRSSINFEQRIINIHRSKLFLIGMMKWKKKLKSLQRSKQAAQWKWMDNSPRPRLGGRKFVQHFYRRIKKLLHDNRGERKFISVTKSSICCLFVNPFAVALYAYNAGNMKYDIHIMGVTSRFAAEQCSSEPWMECASPADDVSMQSCPKSKTSWTHFGTIF